MPTTRSLATSMLSSCPPSSKITTPHSACRVMPARTTSRRPSASWPGNTTRTPRRTRRPPRRSSRRSTRPTRCSAIPRSAKSTTRSVRTGRNLKQPPPTSRTSTLAARGSAISSSSISAVVAATASRRGLMKVLPPAQLAKAELGEDTTSKGTSSSPWRRPCMARSARFRCKRRIARPARCKRTPLRCASRRGRPMAVAFACPARVNPASMVVSRVIFTCACAMRRIPTSPPARRMCITSWKWLLGKQCSARKSWCRRSMVPSSYAFPPERRTTKNSGCEAVACPKARPESAVISS